MAVYELAGWKFVPNQLIKESEITITADFPGELTKQGKFKSNRIANLTDGGTYVIRAGTQFSIYNGRSLFLRRGGARSRTRSRTRRRVRLTLRRRKHRTSK